MDEIDERLFEVVVREVAAKEFAPGLMAKAFSDADGDKDRAIARYIRLRVDQLRREFKIEAERRTAEERQRAEDEERWREAEEVHRQVAESMPNPNGDPAFDRLLQESGGFARQFAKGLFRNSSMPSELMQSRVTNGMRK